MNNKRYRNRDGVSTMASHQNRYSITLMKEMNKALAINLQKHNQKLAELTAKNTNLQAELFNMMRERNSLMDENMKLIETLNNIKEQIGGALGSNGSERVSTKQTAKIGPMVSCFAVHKPKINLRRLNSSDFCSASNVQVDDEIQLSTIAEEQEIEIDELKNNVEEGRAFTENGRNSLLTINLMSPGSNPSSSSNPVAPSLFVNVFPRKRKCASKRSISNGTSNDSIQIDEGLISEEEERPKTTKTKKTENRGEFKVSDQIISSVKTSDCEASEITSRTGILPLRRSARIRRKVTD